MYIHTYHRYVYIYISHHIYIYMMWCYFTSLNEGHTSCHCGPTQTCHNLNSGQSWWFPFLTIIPVRENNEVVIIYPAYSHIYVISDYISHIVCIYIIYIYIHITQSKCIYIYVLYIHLYYIYICIIFTYVLYIHMYYIYTCIIYMYYIYIFRSYIYIIYVHIYIYTVCYPCIICHSNINNIIYHI